MCGIAGLVSAGDVDRELVQAMCDAIAHRGPDSDGFYFDTRAGLGSRRLQIIDLSMSDQPIYNEDRSIAVVYNGEIYNFRELRADLESRGHQFYTAGDTETLVHLYETYGDMFPEKLDGIFSFALWDSNRQRLLLCRDYYGIKPLHYCQIGSRLVFGSEIKSLLLDPGLRPEVNLQGLHLFLNLRYIPGHETLFKDIYRLPAGHVLTWEDGRVEIKRYWNSAPVQSGVRTEAEYVEGLRHYLSEAVRKQLISDVPLGVYLSGGMDSSTVVAYASQHLTEPVETFCVAFNEPTDETEDARVIARHFGTNHHELSLDADPLRRFPEVIWYAEEPKENILQGYLLAQFARQQVTVALSGLGGDELFAGYINNLYMAPSAKLHPLVPDFWARGGAQGFSHTLFNLQNRPGLRRWDQYRRGLQMLLAMGDPARYYLILRNVWDDDDGQFANIYGPELRDAARQNTRRTREYFDEFFMSKRDILTQALTAEFHTKMVDDFLANEDRVSMAHGLEVRVPFLDRDLVAFANSIPISLKLHGGTMKYIFKQAMHGILPEHTLQKKKWGFSFNPYYQFQKDLKTLANRVLTRDKIVTRGIFNYDYLREILDAPPDPRLRWHYFYLWNVVGFEIWFQMFIDGSMSQPSFDIEDYV